MGDLISTRLLARAAGRGSSAAGAAGVEAPAGGAEATGAGAYAATGAGGGVFERRIRVPPRSISIESRLLSSSERTRLCRNSRSKSWPTWSAHPGEIFVLAPV